MKKWEGKISTDSGIHTECYISNTQVDNTINDFIKKWVPNDSAHLLDNDENDGERLREQIKKFIQPPCPHQFFETGRIENVPPHNDTCIKPNEDIIYHKHIAIDVGTQVCCALCGQKRKLWERKELEIL